jgi:hypothetical protein
MVRGLHSAGYRTRPESWDQCDVAAIACCRCVLPEILGLRTGMTCFFSQMPHQEAYIIALKTEPNYLYLFDCDRAKSPLPSRSLSTNLVEISMRLLHFLVFVPLAFGVQDPPPSFTLSKVETHQTSGRNGPVTLDIYFKFSGPSTATSTDCRATWFPDNPPFDFLKCSDPNFAWKFERDAQTTFNNFTILVEHAIWQPEYAFSNSFEGFPLRFKPT